MISSMLSSKNTTKTLIPFITLITLWWLLTRSFIF